MDEKNEPKKESIDEILSDLNGLLNKMPSILDGIRLPETKPAGQEPAPGTKPAPAPEPAAAPEPAPEPAAAPEPAPAGSADAASPSPAENKENIFEKTVKLEGMELPPPGGTVDKMVLQSLDQFMISPDEKNDPSLSEPLALPSGSQPAQEQGPAAAAGAQAEAVPQDEPFREAFKMCGGGEKEKARNPFEDTKDFGIPDIDALMSLSQGNAAQGEAPAPVPAPAEASGDPMPPALAGGGAPPESGPEKIVITAVGDDLGIPPSPRDEIEKTARNIFQLQEPLSAPSENKPEAAARPEEEKTVVLPPSPEQPADAGSNPEAAAVAPEEDKTIVAPPASAGDTGRFILEPTGAPEIVPPPTEAGPDPFAAAVEELSAPAAEIPAPAPAVEPSASDEAEKTMLAAPPEGSEGDKTVIFSGPGQDGAPPAGGSDGPKDFAALAARQAPANVDPARIRNVAFLYAREDEAFCAEVLAEFDAICLRSAAAPMFIGRALVEICEPGTNGNVVMQKVTDAKAVGLICLGAVPQETVYEVENVFTAGGVFFRHLTRENFSHSAALDLVMEFILK